MVSWLILREELESCWPELGGAAVDPMGFPASSSCPRLESLTSLSCTDGILVEVVVVVVELKAPEESKGPAEVMLAVLVVFGVETEVFEPGPGSSTPDRRRRLVVAGTARPRTKTILSV